MRKQDSLKRTMLENEKQLELKKMELKIKKLENKNIDSDEDSVDNIDFLKNKKKETIQDLMEKKLRKEILYKSKQNKKMDIEIGVLQDKFIDKKKVEKEWSEKIAILQEKLLSLPHVVAHQLEGKSKLDIINYLDLYIRDFLTNLSQDV